MSQYEFRKTGGIFDRNINKVIYPKDAEWKQYEQFLNDHNVPDPDTTVEPVYIPKFDFVGAGKARKKRVIQRLAETDPVLALLKREGLS